MSKRSQHFETVCPHRGADEEPYLLECYAVPTGKQLPTFRSNVMLHPQVEAGQDEEDP